MKVSSRNKEKRPQLKDLDFRLPVVAATSLTSVVSSPVAERVDDIPKQQILKRNINVVIATPKASIPNANLRESNYIEVTDEQPISRQSLVISHDLVSDGVGDLQHYIDSKHSGASLITPANVHPKPKLSRTILEQGVKVNGKDYRYAESTNKRPSKYKAAKAFASYQRESDHYEKSQPQANTFDTTGSFGGLDPMVNSAQVVYESSDNAKALFADNSIRPMDYHT